MTPSRRRLLLIAVAVGGIVAVLLGSVATRLTPHVRDRAVSALNQRFRSQVELGTLQVSMFPRPEVLGEQVTLRHNGRRDVEPLIEIGNYSASAGLAGLLSSPLRLRTVELDRLHIRIPPGGLDIDPQRSADGQQPVTARLAIDRLISRAARLEILPRDTSKQPRVFEIHDLVMRKLGDGGGADFEATLTNPKPRGDIATHGTFGPWHSEQPRMTPVRGQYQFRGADLNTIKGIAGILSSDGVYSGVLERIAVRGATDTPDFSVDIAGQPVHLSTRFEAVVDGTTGDTWLERVEARVLDTVIVARGAVVRTQDVKGRRTSLNVTITDGRIEDVLKLAVKATTPILSGRMRLNADFVLPAGDRDVVDKLELAGTFRLDQARFSNVDVQARINTLSQRGQGEPTADGPSVVSSLAGTFALRRGMLTFTDLSFGIPGAVVQLAGTYDLRRELLEFRGHLLLDASLADTTTGFKSLLARVAQPLFRRPGGGSKLPIRISGSRDKPDFGLDVGRALGPG